MESASEVKVKLSDGREFTAGVVGRAVQSDVALLKIDAAGLPALRIGRSNSLQPGQCAIPIGSPFGFDHQITHGSVTAVGRSYPYAGQHYVPVLETDSAVTRGHTRGY